jgi:hypothetical protein
MSRPRNTSIADASSALASAARQRRSGLGRTGVADSVAMKVHHPRPVVAASIEAHSDILKRKERGIRRSSAALRHSPRSLEHEPAASCAGSCELDGVGGIAAVDPNHDAEATRWASQLLDRSVDEPLAAEAGIDAHRRRLIDHRRQSAERPNRCPRIDRHTAFSPSARIILMSL